MGGEGDRGVEEEIVKGGDAGGDGAWPPRTFLTRQRKRGRPRRHDSVSIGILQITLETMRRRQIRTNRLPHLTRGDLFRLMADVAVHREGGHMNAIDERSLASAFVWAAHGGILYQGFSWWQLRDKYYYALRNDKFRAEVRDFLGEDQFKLLGVRQTGRVARDLIGGFLHIRRQ